MSGDVVGAGGELAGVPAVELDQVDELECGEPGCTRTDVGHYSTDAAGAPVMHYAAPADRPDVRRWCFKHALRHEGVAIGHPLEPADIPPESAPVPGRGQSGGAESEGEHGDDGEHNADDGPG